jgi:hypothetical protein
MRLSVLDGDARIVSVLRLSFTTLSMVNFTSNVRVMRLSVAMGELSAF